MDERETGIVPTATRSRAFGILRNILAELRRTGAPTAEPPYEDMVEVIDEIRDSLEEMPGALVSWTVFDEPDKHECTHPFDVAVFSIAVALAMDGKARVTDIGIGALMHDIGVALVPVPVDYREGDGLPPSDLKQMRTHPELGVRVLRQHPRMSAFSKAIVAQHHERMDGSGYPRGLRGPDIHLYSRIVACADVYSSLLIRSHLDQQMTPVDVVDYMMSVAGFELDKDVVRVMLSCVSPFPEGALVRLSTGETATVERLSRGLLTRPVVRLVKDAEGELLAAGPEIDLGRPEHQTKLITAIV